MLCSVDRFVPRRDDERVDEFGGLRQIDSVSYSVAASFREQRRSHLTERDSKVYVFPWAANVRHDRWMRFHMPVTDTMTSFRSRRL